MVLKFTLAVILLLTLSACASLTEAQCQAGNWNAIGQSDGAAGRNTSYLNNHREACASLGITPDASRWAAGRQQGLKQYCTLENAYQIGTRGEAINSVCPTRQRLSMSSAHRAGLEYYSIGQRLLEIEHRRDELQDRLRDLPDAGDNKRLAERKRSLRRQIRDLDRRAERLEWERFAVRF
ncbi:MAG: DUF2799 domain-containing protein [Pseudomonadota bacterium]